jgi:hypothetical protein
MRLDVTVNTTWSAQGGLPTRNAPLVRAPADVAWKSCALRIVFCDPRWVPNPTRRSRSGRAVPLSRVTRVRGRCERGARCRWRDCCRVGRPGGRRDAERAVTPRSRKARPAIRRGEFRHCDPRRSDDHRRICAPGMCRPNASVLAAAATGHERDALSRRAERRQPPGLPTLQQPAATST